MTIVDCCDGQVYVRGESYTCPTCGRYWDDLPAALNTECPHLGEPTGATIQCSSCGGTGGLVQIRHCAIHGKCTSRKTKPKVGPPFDGINCVECRARGQDQL